jgi:hypothetical protein
MKIEGVVWRLRKLEFSKPDFYPSWSLMLTGRRVLGGGFHAEHEDIHA